MFFHIARDNRIAGLAFNVRKLLEIISLRYLTHTGLI